MSEESTLWQVALLDRGESLVVMGRKKYDELYALAQNLTKERDEARALLQSVAKACRGMKEPDEADLSVLGNVLRERDEARAAIEAHKLVSDSTCASLTTAYQSVARERDEARAEVERLRAALEQVRAKNNTLAWRIEQTDSELRDAWRAEDHLRSTLRLLWDQARKQGATFVDETCDEVEAALKEGDR